MIKSSGFRTCPRRYHISDQCHGKWSSPLPSDVIKDIQGIKRMWNIPWYPSSIFMIFMDHGWKMMESIESNIPFTSFHLDYQGIKPQISGIALSSQDDFLQQLERVAEGRRFERSFTEIPRSGGERLSGKRMESLLIFLYLPGQGL